MFPTITASSTKIIYDIPTGKPKSATSAERVFQSGQKGPTCAYYALNMIRERIGKEPESGKEELRFYEALASARRKQITKTRIVMDATLDTVHTLLHSPDFKEKKLNIRSNCREFLPRLEYGLSVVTDEDHAKELKTVFEILKEFADTSSLDDLDLFYKIKFILQINKINSLFLEALGIDPKASYEDFLASCESSWSARKPAWDDLELSIKRRELECIISQTAIEGYKLKTSPWMPTDTIETLISTLSTHGPMYCKGFTGKPYYVGIEPTKFESVEGIDIFGWKKTDARTDLPASHSIVVVGASTEKGGLIYYLDPIDDSSPTSAHRKIYITTYARFIERLFDLRNTPFLIEERPLLPEAKYGLHKY